MRGYDTGLTSRVGALRRRLGAFAGLVVLWLNLWAGAALAAQPVFLDPGLAGLAGGRMVICTSAGRVVVDADGNVLDDASGAPGSGEGPHCLFCLPLMQGQALAPPASLIDREPPQAIALDRQLRVEAFHARLLNDGLSARAPPFS